MTNASRVLFAVPIYRESELEYYSRLDAEDKSRLEKQAQIMKRFIGKSASSNAENQLGNLTPLNPNRNSWRYNRIVGWIEFYSDRRTIKADLWLAKEKPYGKTLKE